MCGKVQITFPGRAMLPADRRRHPLPPELSADELRARAKDYADRAATARTHDMVAALRRLARMYERMAKEREAGDPDQREPKRER